MPGKMPTVPRNARPCLPRLRPPLLHLPLLRSGSPWAIDALIEDSGARPSIDHDFSQIYCRLAEQMRREAWPEKMPAPKVPPPGGDEPLFRAKFEGCIGNGLRFEWPLKQIERLWRMHGDAPKFAFYSASPVHESVDQQIVSGPPKRRVYKRAALEAYDAILSSFLERFLRRHRNTIILLRADHGAQSGPEQIEFDMQVEHRLPWSRLLVPTWLVPNASRLRMNANRLVSPFDLHATLQAAMRRGTTRQAQRMGRPVEATRSQLPIDLLTTEVPALRTCRDARIPHRLCPCQNERSDSGAFSYGPCGGGIERWAGGGRTECK